MGNTPLQTLSLRNQNMMTKLLISQQPQVIQHIEDQKIQPQHTINQMGDTIGHYAAYRALFKVLEHMIKKGDKFQIPNHRGLTALDVALPPVREWIYQNRNSKDYV